MPVYRFRVQKEDHEDSFRDIDIKPTQTFDAFSTCLQKAILFDGSAIAHFFTSDVLWRRVEEVTPFITTKDGDMFETEIADFVDDPHQRFLLYLDTNNNVKLFHVELIKIIKEEEKGVNYPCCSKEVGKPPRQYKKVTTPAVIEEEAKASTSFFDDLDDSEAYVAEEVVGLDEDDEEEIKESFGEEGEEGDNNEEEELEGEGEDFESGYSHGDGDDV